MNRGLQDLTGLTQGHTRGLSVSRARRCQTLLILSPGSFWRAREGGEGVKSLLESLSPRENSKPNLPPREGDEDGEHLASVKEGPEGRLPLSPFTLEQNAVLGYSILGPVYSARVRETGW